MATLLNGGDLPSSDEEDADYDPDQAGEREEPTSVGSVRKRKSTDPVQQPSSAGKTADQRALSAQAPKRAKVDSAWEQLSGSSVPANGLQKGKAATGVSLSSLCRPIMKGKPATSPNDWMRQLGMSAKGAATAPQSAAEPRRAPEQEPPPPAMKPSSRAAAAAALAKAGLAAQSNKTETRRFAGKDVQVHTAPDEEPDTEQRRKQGLDNVLKSLQTVKDVNTLDKSRSDWDTHKQLNPDEATELETYKKSAGKYLDKVDFLSRTGQREYEQDRDRRLAGDMRTRGRL